MVAYDRLCTMSIDYTYLLKSITYGNFGRGLRGTVIFGFGYYTCPDYLRLLAQYLRFQPAFLLGFASLVFGLTRPAYKTVEVFRVLSFTSGLRLEFSFS